MHQTPMKIQNIFPKPFSKYDFVKSYSATAKTPKLKKEKEREAVLVADAIKNTEENLFEHFATKEDLLSAKEELKNEINSLRVEIGAVRTDLVKEIGTVRTDLGKEIGTVRTDLGKEIGALEERIGLKMEILSRDLTIRMTIIVGSLLALSSALQKFIS